MRGDELARHLESSVGARVKEAVGIATGETIRLVPAVIGTGGRTFMVEVEGTARFVLRAWRSRRRLRRMVRASRRLSRLGVPVARMLWSDGSIRNRLACGSYLSAEEYLPGIILGHIGPEETRWPALAALAPVLARLHSDHRPGWGRGWRNKWAGYGQFRTRAVARAIRWLVRQKVLGDREADALRRALRRWRRELNAVSDFQLIHNDVNFGNVLVSGDGSIHLLDLERIRYDRRERELAAVLGVVLDLDVDLGRRFLDLYADAGNDRPELRLLDFELVALCLGRWASSLPQAPPRVDPEQPRDPRSDVWEARARERFPVLLRS